MAILLVWSLGSAGIRGGRGLGPGSPRLFPKLFQHGAVHVRRERHELPDVAVFLLRLAILVDRDHRDLLVGGDLAGAADRFIAHEDVIDHSEVAIAEAAPRRSQADQAQRQRQEEARRQPSM
ncbi:MAG: hypothetical protein L6Q69_18215 [Zoogloea sp.]|nr:hypothetical protein [Zoogloea sp.]